jgi:hypothetical protein
MMKLAPIFLALTLCGIPLGCGDHFASEKDELEYLSSVASPTPRQWNRRKELAKAEADREVAEHDHWQADGMKWDAILRKDPDALKNSHAPIDMNVWSQRANGYRSAGEMDLALLYYRDMVAKHPGDLLAERARKRIKELEAK